MGRRIALAVLTASLCATLAVPSAPAVAGASPRPAAALPAATSDAYDPADDSRGARDLTSAIGGYGAAPRVERHVSGAASASGPADEDWFRFTVRPSEAPATTYLIEAKAVRAGLDPVIEVYAGDTTPTPYAGLPAAAGGRTGIDATATAGADGAEWIAGGSASLDFIPPAPGTYHVRIRPYYDAGHDGHADGFATGYGAYDLRIKKGHVTRLAGADRIATAVAVSKERYPDGALAGGAAVVASGYGFADGLAGSTLAGAVGGPLLLTRPDRLPGDVRAELVRLKVKRVYVLGGGPAVSAAVARAIAAIPGVSVSRVAGRDRYETAAAVARKADSVRAGGTARTAFLVSGLAFPDALSASPMAASNVAPILLTRPDRLSGAARAALKDRGLGITDVVVVGGGPAVSSAVAREVTGILGEGHVRRVSGADRYRTSAAFAIWATAGGKGTGSVGTPATPGGLTALAFGRMGLALGTDFPDALAGGVACGAAGAPVLLTRGDRFSPWIYAGLDPFDGVKRGSDYYSKGTAPLGRSYAFGGANVLGADVFRDLDWLTGRHLTSY